MNLTTKNLAIIGGASFVAFKVLKLSPVTSLVIGFASIFVYETMRIK